MTDASAVATTGSDGAQQAQPVDRLERLGYPRRNKHPLKELAPKHRLLIEYMVHGCRHEWVSRIGKQPGEPLSLLEAADLLRIRRRNARSLFNEPAFKRELGLAVEQLRSGEALASLRTVIRVRDTVGDGKAADRKVQLEAARDLLGDAVGKASGGSAVTVNVSTTLQAGYVLDLTPQGKGKAIEGQAVRLTDE